MTVGRAHLMLAIALLIAGCAQDKEFEGVTVSRGSKDIKTPYIYNAIGPLEFVGQNPVAKATKVMNAACPQGQPTLVVADGPVFKIENSANSLLIAIFTCNQLIPGVE